MKNQKTIKSIMLFSLLYSLFSCGPTDESITPLEINSISLDKLHIFTDKVANLNIDATGFDKIIATSENEKIKITKESETSYKISSEEATSGTLLLSIISNDNPESNQLKSYNINFYEHGTSDFHIFEGIVIDVDEKEKVITLHGEPDGKITGTSDGVPTETWSYLSKGFEVYIVSDRVSSVRMFDSWSREFNGLIKNGTPYQHSIGGLNFSSSTKMNNVETKLGIPDEILASSSETSRVKWFRYEDLNSDEAGTQIANFYFISDSVDDYKTKKLEYVILF